MDSPYLARIKAATALMLDDIAPLGDADMAAPTLLPGWDRAMLLTHLAANADGAWRGVTAAARAEVGEVYPGGREARNAEIDAGQGAAAAALRQRLSAAATRLDAALAEAPDEAWHRKAISPQGEVEVGNGLVVGRLREVLVHHVDLDIGYRPDDWPTAWVMEEMDRCLLDLPRRLPEGIAVVMESTDLGQRWVAGSGDEVDVVGTSAQLFAWVTGRAPAVGGQPCPPLRPWR
jgi:maleylpyruvate isomerase